MMKFDPKDRLSFDKLDHLLRVKLIKLINKQNMLYTNPQPKQDSPVKK